MSSGNDKKTRDELLAEVEALKEELEQRGSHASKATAAASASPVFSAPITRRESLVSWVAPVILALPVVQAVGMVWRPGTAHAAATKAPTPAKAAPSAKPTLVGRCVVTPTAAPS